MIDEDPTLCFRSDRHPILLHHRRITYTVCQICQTAYAVVSSTKTLHCLPDLANNLCFCIPDEYSALYFRSDRQPILLHHRRIPYTVCQICQTPYAFVSPTKTLHCLLDLANNLCYCMIDEDPTLSARFDGHSMLLYDRRILCTVFQIWQRILNCVLV